MSRLIYNNMTTQVCVNKNKSNCTQKGRLNNKVLLSTKTKVRISQFYALNEILTISFLEHVESYQSKPNGLSDPFHLDESISSNR